MHHMMEERYHNIPYPVKLLPRDCTPTADHINDHHETIIVGAGPAGLQMGHFMNKAQRDYVILEATNKAGQFFAHHPRHRVLHSINKRFNPFPEFEYNMRHDWNSLLSHDRSLLFTKYSTDLFPNADDLVRYLNDFAIKLEIKVRYNTRVVNISKEDRPGAAKKLFYLKANDGREYSCKVLIMATGAVSERIPGIPGIELADTYSKHDIDTRKYDGKLVAIIGRGNSAFEVANHLAPHAAIIHICAGRALKHAWNTHFLGDLRAINNTVLDMYQLKSLHSYLGIEAVKLSKQDDQIAVDFRDLVLHWEKVGYFTDTKPYDYVIVCAGWNYVDTSLFAENCRPATKKGGIYAVLKTNWESDNVENLFFIGTSMQANDRQTASGFIHGFRYNIQTMHHMLEERYHNVLYPCRLLSCDVSPVADLIVERTSVEASMYHLNTFMGDVIVVPEDSYEKVIYYCDLPIAYAKEQKWFKNAKHIFTVVLKYATDGSYLGDQFWKASLRPSVSYYHNGKLIDDITGSESLVQRFDTDDFPGGNANKNRNAIKNFINKHTNLNPGEQFFDSFLASENIQNRLFQPLTEDESAKIPPEYFRKLEWDSNRSATVFEAVQ